MESLSPAPKEKREKRSILIYNNNIFLFNNYFFIGLSKNCDINEHFKIKIFNFWTVFDFKKGVLAWLQQQPRLNPSSHSRRSSAPRLPCPLRPENVSRRAGLHSRGAKEHFDMRREQQPADATQPFHQFEERLRQRNHGKVGCDGHSRQQQQQQSTCEMASSVPQTNSVKHWQLPPAAMI